MQRPKTREEIRSSWPRDQFGFVFMANALNEIGSAMFAKEWKKDNFRLSRPQAFESLARSNETSTRSIRCFAHNSLMRRQGYVPRIIKIKDPSAKPVASWRGPDLINDFEFQDSDWDWARDYAARTAKRLLREFELTQKVIECFYAAALSGEIETGLRPLLHADVELLKPNVWSLVRLEHVLATFQICTNGASSAFAGNPDQKWIFVTAASLHKLVGSITRSNKASEEVAVGTAASEARAVRFVAELLRKDPELKKAPCETAIKAEGILVSGNGFKSRIWPEARKSAGLEARGKPGRAPKSSN
jgi:hypothetical protein